MLKIHKQVARDLSGEPITTKERLVTELWRAGQLEHASICQYLSAAHSLKKHPAESGVTDEQFEQVREWQAAILLVARGEMEHLGLVCNLLSAVGASPSFCPPAFPHAGPGITRFSLEPFSEETLVRFIELEASHQSGEVFQLYSAIRQGFEVLECSGPSIFVGDRHSQVSNRSIGLPPGWYDIELTEVLDCEGALVTIDRILEAGTRSECTRADVVLPLTHCERFEAILREYRDLRQSTSGFNPVRPVVANPSTTLAGNSGCTLLEHPLTHSAASLFQEAYETTLLMLTRFYALTDETEEERRFLSKIAFRPMMTVIMRPLAEMLTQMPVDNVPATRTAGATFEVHCDLLLPDDKTSAWELIRNRLLGLQRKSAQLQTMMAQEDSDWAVRLAPRALFVAENLEAIAISFAHHMEMAALTSVFRKLMESS